MELCVGRRLPLLSSLLSGICPDLERACTLRGAITMVPLLVASGFSSGRSGQIIETTQGLSAYRVRRVRAITKQGAV